MSHKVKCIYCGQIFDRDKIPFTQISSRRFAHQDCTATESARQSQEEKDKKELEKYIMELFKIDYITPRIQKQINQYINEYHFSYSGIRKALIYNFEIKHGEIEKANGGIGIVPYVYKQAYNYYYSLWQAQQKNEDKNVEMYIPAVKEIIIPIPERKIRKRNLFSFLDKEEVLEDGK